MAQFGMVLLLLTQSVTSAFIINLTKIKVYPEHGTIYGVSQVSHLDGYAFNASVARDVCHQLGLTIADKSQVKYALDHGFETCKFGWIDEQVAVIPRIQSKANCGKGEVGMVVWRQHLWGKFDVFCFNSTDFEAQESQTTTANSQPTTAGAHSHPTTHSASHGSQFNLQVTSSSPSHSVRPNFLEEKGEAHALGSNSPAKGAGLIASLATIFIFLLVIVIAVWYFRTSRFCVALWNGTQPKKCIETEDRGKQMKDFQSGVENHNMETKNEVTVTINPETEEAGAKSVNTYEH
ncbi:lymphatic vessel endothelial hyaluronic acid receptor 1a [Trichomycterus rosablanca]|uniref:lymphatic vessel endothelial hyaluronic acid receptor 1a n=1 Tax=Trichomycterus rosablanca TaxID=2290929 RepID=UPI002F351208